MTIRLAPGITRREAVEILAAGFTRAGLAEPEPDATILVEEAAGLTRSQLRLAGDELLGPMVAARLEALAARRLAREPVFRIVGRREFWGLSLRVTPDVLDPRPDTETVVEAVRRRRSDRREETLRLLDLGTGSGALLCALLAVFPNATGVGVDRSAAACAVARDNLAACGFAARGAIVEGDWTAPVIGPFDIVVSNPPYIPAAAISGLDPEVRDHDPHVALDGGPDGLDAYRVLSPTVAGLLSARSLVAFEVGWDQAGAVAAMLRDAGFIDIGVERDLGGHERVVLATLSGAGAAR